VFHKVTQRVLFCYAGGGDLYLSLKKRNDTQKVQIPWIST
jgi:hypothetical protein